MVPAGGEPPKNRKGKQDQAEGYKAAMNFGDPLMLGATTSLLIVRGEGVGEREREKWNIQSPTLKEELGFVVYLA